ncbi:MAG: tetratricopeptide repeat protein [Eubacteriales bacterium]|nr:tetratricopeptide repeat protein [Eubacteriales bacterium]
MGKTIISMEDLQRRAAQGDVRAMLEYAMRLKRGIDCEQDLSLAVEYYAEAAARGSGEAARQLGMCYTNGTGVTRDLKKAADCYRRGAALGNPDAMYRLFQVLSVGEGTPADLDQADQWLQRAAKAGHRRAAATYRRLSASGKTSSSLKYSDPDPEGDGPGSVRVEAVSPSAVYNLVDISEKEDKKPSIIPVDYIPPVPQNVRGLFILAYAAVGALSGFLLRSVFVNNITVMGFSSLLNDFNSVDSFTIYMTATGAAVGLLIGVLLSKLMNKIKEGMLLYLPLLGLPLVIALLSSVIMSAFEVGKGILAGLFTIIVYIIVGFSTLGSTTNS